MASSIWRGILGTAIGYYGGKYISPYLQDDKWEKLSFRGTAVSLRGGFQTAMSLGGGLIMLLPDPVARAALLVSTAGGISGWLDDHYEEKFAAQGKGLKGHLGGLKQGKLSSGIIKIVAIGTGAAIASSEIKKVRSVDKSSLVDLLVDTTLIAGSANLINLFDLRPGRALKIVSFLSLYAWQKRFNAPGVAISLLGATALSAPKDFRGETMLGDLGANALGGATGVLLALAPAKKKRLLRAGIVATLIFLSEKISFSRVINQNSVLSYLDNLGITGGNK